MKVEEIESAVYGLLGAELARFSELFEEFVADQWDHQIERDLATGKLDSALKQADEDYNAGHCTRL